MIPTRLRKVIPPPDIKTEVQTIIKNVLSKDLDVCSELKKIATRKTVPKKEKLAALWLIGQYSGKETSQFLKNIIINKKLKLEDRCTAVWALAQNFEDSLASFLATIFLTETDKCLIWEAAKGLSFKRKTTPYYALIKGLNDANTRFVARQPHGRLAA
jgi:hypothetical protein